ncbi:hypothetical protein BDQ17DRAFT_423491 [Cyathus striatus]|nr:hypothetical protein BDQ17DRAFT_423491 [Cyathus striatus]
MLKLDCASVFPRLSHPFRASRTRLLTEYLSLAANVCEHALGIFLVDVDETPPSVQFCRCMTCRRLRNASIPTIVVCYPDHIDCDDRPHTTCKVSTWDDPGV